MIALIAAAAAFVIAALAGKPLIGLLNRKKLGRAGIVYKDGAFHPGQEVAPEFGGALLLIGLVPAALIGMIVHLFTVEAGRGFVFGKTITLLIGCVLMAVIGMIDDRQRAIGQKTMPLLLRCGLIWCGGLAFLMTLRIMGGYSELILIPFTGGQSRLGGIWMLWLILGAALGSDRLQTVSGEAASVSLVQLLTFAGVSAVFGSRVETIVGFGAAGAVLGLLLFAFPPEKLREGSGGRILMGTLPYMGAILGGTPLFILPTAFPFIFEAIYGMIRVAVLKAGKKTPPDTFGGWLMEKGMSGKAVSGLMTGLAAVGGIIAIGAAYLYL